MSGQMYNDDIASDVKISSYGSSLSNTSYVTS